MRNALLPFIILLFSCGSHAAITSDWDLNLGYATLNYTYADSLKEKLESATALEVNYNLNTTLLNSALNLSFMEIYSSDGKQIPFTRMAVGGRYYFAGFNGEKVVYDSTVFAKVWRPTPFIGVNFGISNLSVEGFNASFVDFSLRAGVEIPLFAQTLLIGQMALSSSLTAASEFSSVNYDALTLYAGLRFTAFE